MWIVLVCCFEGISFINKARWLSWLERRPVTAEVVGSSPIQVATYADLAHLVERHLAKVEVASSSLVIRSIFILEPRKMSVSLIITKFVVEIFTAFFICPKLPGVFELTLTYRQIEHEVLSMSLRYLWWNWTASSGSAGAQLSLLYALV